MLQVIKLIKTSNVNPLNRSFKHQVFSLRGTKNIHSALRSSISYFLYHIQRGCERKDFTTTSTDLNNFDNPLYLWVKD